MLARLMLLICLGVTAINPKTKGVKDSVLPVGAAVEQLLNQTDALCTGIFVTDSFISTSSVLKDLRRTWCQLHGLAIFETTMKRSNTSVNDHLSRLIYWARQVRWLSWCTMVVVVSHDPAFLVAFAEWSLRGRLLVWATRLVVVTSLAVPELRCLLAGHWTFSMMNVVFLNKDGDAEALRYNVYTYLPFRPDGDHIVKLALWTPKHGFKYLSSEQLFTDKFANFQEAPVNVTAETYMPYWGKEHIQAADGSMTIKYLGSDYRLLEAVASTLNFTFRVLPTSSWEEVTSLVEERISWIATIFHVMLAVRTERYDFTYAYEHSHSSFALAKPGLEPRWKSLYYPFSGEVWMAVIAPLFLIPLILSLIIRASQSEDGGIGIGLGAVFQDIMGMLLGQNLPLRLPNTYSSRVLVAAWLLFALVLGLAYRGNLTACLTLPKYPSRPETLQEIVDAVDMVTVPEYGEAHRIFFSQSESPLFQALGRLMSPGLSLMQGLRKALLGKSCHYEAKKFLQYEILDKFTEADGSTRLYVSREPVSPSPSGWPIPHDAPYKAHLDSRILAVVEAGLYERWGSDLLTETRIRSQQAQRQLQSELHADVGSGEMKGDLPFLTISHTQGAFFLLLLGLIVGILAFVGEFYIYRNQAGLHGKWTSGVIEVQQESRK